MQAVEFEASAMLKQEEKARRSKKSKLAEITQLFEEIRERKIFQSIEDPVEWQRKIRNEWE